MDRFSFGEWCEEQVAQDLEVVKGWRVLARRVRFKGGELDLVAETPEGKLYFIEVKGRRQSEFGNPMEAMTPLKLARVYRSALEWKRRNSDPREARFLFVGVELKEGRVGLDWQHF